jgi:hypothetical protein
MSLVFVEDGLDPSGDLVEGHTILMLGGRPDLARVPGRTLAGLGRRGAVGWYFLEGGAGLAAEGGATGLVELVQPVPGGDAQPLHGLLVACPQLKELVVGGVPHCQLIHDLGQGWGWSGAWLGIWLRARAFR